MKIESTLPNWIVLGFILSVYRIDILNFRLPTLLLRKPSRDVQKSDELAGDAGVSTGSTYFQGTLRSHYQVQYLYPRHPTISLPGTVPISKAPYDLITRYSTYLQGTLRSHYQAQYLHVTVKISGHSGNRELGPQIVVNWGGRGP